jgi:hypothetical protein
MFYVLDVLMREPTVFGIGWLILALAGLSMMIIDIVRGELRREWSIGLLLAGIAYAAVNVGVFMMTLQVDVFAIFDLAYIYAVFPVGPGLVLAAVVVSRAYRQFSRRGMAGFAVWVGCVAFAHLFVIAALSANV